MTSLAAAPVDSLGIIDSTNAEARRRAEAGKRGSVWLIADSQTGGVGRSGRVWHSPQGNLYTTLLMPFSGGVSQAALMSFVACLAVAETLDHFVAPERVSLKWPNDALLDGKKIAGVLLEAGGSEGDRWLAVGIGINLLHKPQEYRWPPIALGDVTDAAPAPIDALKRLSDAFAARASAFQSDGFEPIRTAWLARAARLGEPIEARLPKETRRGIFTGLAADGSLLLETSEGETRIAAADIHFPASEEAAHASGH